MEPVLSVAWKGRIRGRQLGLEEYHYRIHFVAVTCRVMITQESVILIRQQRIWSLHSQMVFVFIKTLSGRSEDAVKIHIFNNSHLKYTLKVNLAIEEIMQILAYTLSTNPI